MTQRKLLFVFCAVLLSMGCKDKKKGKEDVNIDESFNKEAMLANFSDNIIVPAYAQLKSSIDDVKAKADLFVATPDSANLSNLRGSFQQAYINYQYISVFEFGPADSELLRASFNTFPCDTTEINNKIASGSLSLSTVADLDSKGFPAIDFLLYRTSDSTVLEKFTTSPSAANAKNYLTALVNELQSKTNNVVSGWGNYASSFKGNTSSSAGSPIGLLVNQLNYDLEILKNAKIAIPAGIKSLGTLYPEKTEAYYSTRSLILAKENLQAIENIYLGKSGSGDGVGFDDYLVHLDAQSSSGSLNDAIKSKFASAKTKLNAIPETLSQTVVNNTAVVQQAYNELQQLVVLLKVDMTSALGVAITYQDNDGD